MKIGYARVSTAEQNLSLQKDALQKAECEKLFEDVAGGAADERPGLQKAIQFARAGDVLVVWKLDRLGRSLKHLIETVSFLQENKIGFQSLQENIDTTTSGGKLVFHIFASLAEFERDLIRDRTQAGLASARARGRLGGRPKSMDSKKVNLAKAMISDSHITIPEICQTLGISKTTLYRYIKQSS